MSYITRLVPRNLTATKGCTVVSSLKHEPWNPQPQIVYCGSASQHKSLTGALPGDANVSLWTGADESKEACCATNELGPSGLRLECRQQCSPISCVPILRTLVRWQAIRQRVKTPQYVHAYMCVCIYIYTHNIMQQVHFLLYYITSSGIVIHIKYSILIYCTLLYLVIPYLISYYVNYNTRSSQIILLYTVLLFLHVQLVWYVMLC